MNDVSMARRWHDRWAAHTGVALGVAPSPRWLTAWGLPDDVAGARVFSGLLVEQAAELAAVKLQTPFFERFGLPGQLLLADTAHAFRQAGTLVIADAKRGDTADTAAAYADCYLGPDSFVGADLVTALPYLGFADLRTLCELAADRDAGVLVLIRTSNHPAGLQTAREAGGLSVAAALAEEITAFNTEYLRAHPDSGPIGPAAALVGAQADEARALLARLPNALVSMPGLGRPGRTVAEFAGTTWPVAARVLLPITSGLLRAGPSGFADALRQWQREVRAAQQDAQQDAERARETLGAGGGGA